MHMQQSIAELLIPSTF